MKFEQSIILGYQEYNFPNESIGLQKWILRNQNVEFGKTRIEKCPFLVCLLEDFTLLQEWIDTLETLLCLIKPTWVHNVRLSLFPKRDRSHWVIPDILLHFLANHHLRLIISFTGWGDDKCGRYEGRILRDITYRVACRKNFLINKQNFKNREVEHITLYTSDDMDSFFISSRKLRKCYQKKRSLIVSIRRLS